MPSALLNDNPLQMTPQEKYLYQLHLQNLKNPVKNPDGSISTLKQISIEVDGKIYNIPTVWDAKIHDPKEAISRAKRIGLNKFPAYNSEAEAEARYNQMHKLMEQDGQKYLGGQ